MTEPVRRIFSILNTPIVIWFLSIVIVGVFGAVYTDVQRCRTATDLAVANFHRLGTEITNRRRELYFAILRASSIDELRSAPIVRDWESWYTYLDFKGRTIEDLADEYTRVGSRLSYFPPAVWDIIREQVRQSSDAWKKSREGKESHVHNLDFTRPDFSRLTDADLPILQDIAHRGLSAEGKSSFEILLLEVVPACSYSTSLTRVFFGWPTYLAKLEKREIKTPPQ